MENKSQKGQTQNFFKKYIISIKIKALELYVKRENIFRYSLSFILTLPFFLLFCFMAFILAGLLTLTKLPIIQFLTIIPSFICALLLKFLTKILNLVFILKLKKQPVCLWKYFSTPSIDSFLNRLDIKLEKIKRIFRKKDLVQVNPNDITLSLNNLKQKFAVPPCYEMVLTKFAAYKGRCELTLPLIPKEEPVDADITLYSFNQILEYQKGYGLDQNNKWIKGWNKDFLVIADCDNDPYCIDTKLMNSPVYFALHGTGEWKFEVAYKSVVEFLNHLKFYRSNTRRINLDSLSKVEYNNLDKKFKTFFNKVKFPKTFEQTLDKFSDLNTSLNSKTSFNINTYVQDNVVIDEWMSFKTLYKKNDMILFGNDYFPQFQDFVIFANVNYSECYLVLDFEGRLSNPVVKFLDPDLDEVYFVASSFEEFLTDNLKIELA